MSEKSEQGSGVSQSALIDRACDQFEEAWNHGSSPPLAEFVPSHLEAKERQKLLQELALIDLERRWQRSPQLDTSEVATLGDGKIKEFVNPNTLPLRPKLEDYVERFPDLGPLEELPLSMITTEYRVRLRFGDSPLQSKYAERFPGHAGLIEALQEAVAENPPALLKIFNHENSGSKTANPSPAFKMEFTGGLILGRQRSGEPEAFCRSTDPDTGGIRVVIANLTETQYSRKQVSLHLLSQYKLRIKNLGAPEVGLDRHHRLQQNQESVVDLPALITVGERVVCVEPTESPDVEVVQLDEATLPPGSHPTENDLKPPPTLAAFELSKEQGAEQVKGVLKLLETTMGVFQSAANSPDFFAKAAQAVVDMADLDTAAVLSRGCNGWELEIAKARRGKEVHDEWWPSATMLDRLLTERRTLLQFPSTGGSMGQSLMDVVTLVAAPILNAQGEVIGAIYGDRRSGIGGRGKSEISKIEATLVNLVACGVAAGIARVEQEKAALAARVRFEQFFSPELARHLENEPDLLQGKDAEVSILFVDITGFSRISRRLGPERTLAWINDAMSVMSDCIIAQRGVLVDYVGDAIMAMWGAPEVRPDHAELACQAALNMFAKLPSLNERWEEILGESMGLRIGINSGVARVGDVGSKRKFKYGALGNTVNLASRVQGATRYVKAEIVITESTALKLGERFSPRRLCQVQVLNIDEPVALYELPHNVTSGWNELKSCYQRALEVFERGEMRPAAKLLGDLLAQHPDDGPGLLLLSRTVNEMVEESEKFTPVWTLPGK